MQGPEGAHRDGGAARDGALASVGKIGRGFAPQMGAQPGVAADGFPWAGTGLRPAPAHGNRG